jgi:hypothetical protein
MANSIYERPRAHDHSVDLFCVVLRESGSRHVSTALMKYRFLGFHSNLHRSVYFTFEIVAAGDLPAIAHIGPGKRGMNEV